MKYIKCCVAIYKVRFQAYKYKIILPTLILYIKLRIKDEIVLKAVNLSGITKIVKP